MAVCTFVVNTPASPGAAAPLLTTTPSLRPPGTPRGYLPQVSQPAITPTPNGRVIYVAPNGDDMTADGSMSKPFGRLSRAVEREGKPGTTIYLRGGRYAFADYASRDEVWIRQDAGLGGAPGRPLVIAPYPGEQPELVNVRLLVDASYVTVRGLLIREIGPAVASWNGRSTHVDLADNTIIVSEAGYGAISFAADDSVAQNNVITITTASALGTQSHGIYLLWGRNNTLRNNQISGATGYGIHVYDEDKYPGFAPAYNNIVLEGNLVSSSTQRSGIIVSGNPGVSIDGVLIRNNVLARNNHVGLIVSSGGATVRNIAIYNNTFFQNGARGGIALSQLAGSVSGITITNNIFDNGANANCASNCSWFAPVHIAREAAVGNVTVSRNLYFPQTLGVSGVSDASALYGDPRFVAAAQHDYRLQAGSPAVDSGLALPAVSADRAGIGRPQGAGVDLGAHERQAAAR